MNTMALFLIDRSMSCGDPCGHTLLGQAIAPSSTRLRDARTVVMHAFAYLAAVPTTYIMAVAKQEQLNGPGQLLPVSI